MMSQQAFDTIVIGGGAAGIMAAISAKTKGMSVLIAERMPRLGKKILATGSGRCNLSNEILNASFYNSEAREIVESTLSEFGAENILKFFKDLGLAVYADNGRIFPVTNQASSVLELLEMEVTRLGIPRQLNCEITDLRETNEGFHLTSKNLKHFDCRQVVLCGGGKSYPALGSNGNAYALTQRFGHKVIEPVPSTVPLVTKDPWCHLLQGQKITSCATGIIRGRTARKIQGEVLFTKYGLSGTAILDISEDISIALNRHHDHAAEVSLDLIPFIDQKELREEIAKRITKELLPEHLLIGLLPNKFSAALIDILKTRHIDLIITTLKDKRFQITGTRGWNEAEFTAGGIDTAEVDKNSLQSKLKKGLYFAGEILNVQGQRGGYNLAWAWASGYIAGMTKAS